MNKSRLPIVEMTPSHYPRPLAGVYWAAVMFTPLHEFVCSNAV